MMTWISVAAITLGNREGISKACSENLFEFSIYVVKHFCIHPIDNSGNGAQVAKTIKMISCYRRICWVYSIQLFNLTRIDIQAIRFFLLRIVLVHLNDYMVVILF